MTEREDSGERREQEARQEVQSLGKGVLSYIHDLAYILAGVMLLFLLLFRVVVVSGPSMYDTLMDGDYLLLLNSSVSGTPHPGDVVVAAKKSFREGEPIVKRVIATEGQTVDIDFYQGIVYVDGVALEEDYTYTPTTNDEGMEFPITLQEGELFLMGDNRMRSMDSRNPEIGIIDRREVMGKVLFILFPGVDEGKKLPDFSRIGGV